MNNMIRNKPNPILTWCLGALVAGSLLSGCALLKPQKKEPVSAAPKDTLVDGLLAEAAARFSMPNAPLQIQVLDEADALFGDDPALQVTVHRVVAARVKPFHSLKPLAVINPDVQQLDIEVLRVYRLQDNRTYSSPEDVEIISSPPAKDLPVALSRITLYRLPELQSGEALEVKYTLKTLPPALPHDERRNPGNQPPTQVEEKKDEGKETKVPTKPTATPTPEPIPLSAEPSFSYRWGDRVPCLKRHLTLRAPKGFSLYGSRLRIPPGLKMTETEDGTTHRTELSLDGWQDAIPYESFQPPLEDLTGVTAFTVFPTWDKALEDYRRRVKALARPTDRLKALLNEAESAGAGTPETRLAHMKKALHDAVSWVDTGLPVYLNPDRPVDEILESGKGSSHDLAVLFVAALRELNLNGEVFLYRHSDEGGLLDQTPALAQFEGVLVGADAKKVWTWMDPTESLSPPGILPLEALSATALGVKTGIEWKDTPPFTAKDNRKERDVLMQIAPDGSLDCKVTLQAFGSSEVSLRQFFRAHAPGERKRLVEQGMAKLFPGVSLTEYRYSDYRYLAEPLQVEYRFRLPSYVETDRKGKPVFYPVVFDDVSDFLANMREGRRTPAVLPQNFNSVTRVLVKLPPKWKVADLPDDASVANSVAEFLNHAKIEFGTLVYERYVGLKKRMILPGSEYKDLQDFTKDVLKQDRTPFEITLPASEKPAPRK